MKRRTFLGIIFFVAIFLSLHFTISFNEGFSLKKVVTKLTKNSLWKAPVISADDPIMQTFNKPFTYLGRGGQAFVFESFDKEYVIKLIRYDLLTPTLSMRLNRHFFSDEARYERKRKRFLEANDSYYLAYKDLAEETNVVYAHLVKTQFFNRKITLIDNLGKEYKVDLDTLGFILQKKVTLLGDVLSGLQKENNSEKIKQTLCDYLSLLKRRSDKGFWIKDHNQFLRNYGLYKGRVYEIDVGSYRRKNGQDEAFFKKNNLDHLKRLHLWVEKTLPEHLSFFNDKIEQIINQ